MIKTIGVHMVGTDCWAKDLKRDDSLAPFIVVVDYMKPLGHPISHNENVQQVFETILKLKASKDLELKIAFVRIDLAIAISFVWHQLVSNDVFFLHLDIFHIVSAC